MALPQAKTGTGGSPGGDGGGIYNAGTLTLRNSTVTGNATGSGGNGGAGYGGDNGGGGMTPWWRRRYTVSAGGAAAAVVAAARAPVSTTPAP